MLRALPPGNLSDARNLVFLIIDGLGDGYLCRNGGGGQLFGARRQSISAVFPSTTASAITTSFTGLSPLEHGLTGWFTYFGEADCVAAPLPFRMRGGDVPLAARGTTAMQLFPGRSYLDTLDSRAIVVSWNAIIESDYNRHHCGRAERRAYGKLESFVEQVVAAVKSGPERKFIYAYWWQFDAIAHRFGVGSQKALEHFHEIDRAFQALLARLEGTDTRIVATADHGFVDSMPGESLSIDECPGLAAMLRLPLCGERRLAWCHVQPGREEEFAARAAQWLGDRADVRPSRELLEEGWLGPGTPHPRIRERVGDVALVMRERNTVQDRVYGETQFVHIGNHGGTSEDEMRIPLITAHL